MVVDRELSACVIHECALEGYAGDFGAVDVAITIISVNIYLDNGAKTSKTKRG